MVKKAIIIALGVVHETQYKSIAGLLEVLTSTMTVVLVNLHAQEWHKPT